MSIKYFDWLSKKEGIRIKHAANGGEVKIRRYKIDGFIEDENRGIEFLG